MRVLADLNGLAGLVHDWWFDLEQAIYDEQTKRFMIQLGEKRRGPYSGRVVTVTGAMGIRVIDEAKIGIYDFNQIQVSPGCVRLTSGFPLEIQVDVGLVSEVSVETDTDSFYAPVLND